MLSLFLKPRAGSPDGSHARPMREKRRATVFMPDHQMRSRPGRSMIQATVFPMIIPDNAYVCDFGLECGVLVTQRKLKRIRHDGWAQCGVPSGFEPWRKCHWFESANMILCLDDTGLGLLLTDHPLSQEGLEYARYRLRKVGRMLRWDRVYRYRHIIRRISLMRLFSPQTRYFNAGLGRTEVYIW